MVKRARSTANRYGTKISNYIEGDVEAGLRAAMDEHFRTCAKCKSVLEGMRNVVQLYGDERMIEVPAGFGRRLERRLTQGRRSADRGWSAWSAWLVPVAAMLLIAGGVRMASSRDGAASDAIGTRSAGHSIPPDMVVVVSDRGEGFPRARM